jgi:hypothetical protein
MKVTFKPMRSCFLSSHSQFVKIIFFAMVANYMDMHVLLKLAIVTTIFISFDLWVSR